jgi:hypothetical protein
MCSALFAVNFTKSRHFLRVEHFSVLTIVIGAGHNEVERQ